MTEGLFLITTLFVAYVVYVIINEKKAEKSGDSPATSANKKESAAAASASASASSTTTTTKPKPAPAKPAAAKAAPAATPAASKPVAEKAPAAPKKPAAKASATKKAEPALATAPAATSGKGLKDPNTGEVVTSYTNYRFMKRWIKEALVTEGLVEKVYKNDELNAALDAKIKDAVTKLEGIKKYQP
jgi:cytoskeletal protein RodZ